MESQYKLEAKKTLEVYKKLIFSKNYKNANIICIQFELWINLLLYMKIIHNKNGNKCMNLYKYYSDNTIIKRNESVFNIKKKYSSVLLLIFYYVPLPFSLLNSGSRYLLDRYIFFLTSLKLLLIKNCINESLKTEFIINLKFQNIKHYSYIKENLPDVFFYNQFSAKSIPKKVFLSPDNLFSDNFCHITFINKPLNLIGIQHGGFTLEAKNNLFHEFDLKVTNKMLYWGLGPDNIKQNRFHYKTNNYYPTQDIYLINSLKTTPVLSFFFRDLSKIQDDLFANRFKLKKYINFSVLQHPRSKNIIHDSLTLDKLDIKNINSSIFLLDSPFHTFFYRAVYQNLRFILYFSKKWDTFYTQEYQDLLIFLKKHNFLFYWGEESSLVSQITHLQNANCNKYTNESIRMFLCKKISSK